MSSRRHLLKQTAAVIGAASTGLLLPEIARAQSNKIRIGFMLPYTGTFAQLGIGIDNAFRMAIDEQGGKLGGREIEWFKLDDESNPAKGVENAQRLVQRDKVDVLVGTVHSGVQMGIHRVVRNTNVINLIPNAGVHAATREQCAPNVFRTSFSNSQPTLALGKPMVQRGHKKAVWITWNYAAGEEAFEGFKQSYEAAGGTIIKSLGLPFPQVEFQALLTEIASLKPDAVACFFAGGGAAKSTLHYSDSLDTERNKSFRLAYAKTFKLQPDVYTVQGYDSALLLIEGANAVKGDLANRKVLYEAMEKAKIKSPRGVWTMSKSHNPIQDIYLREVVKGENKVIGVAAKALADPGTGCRMG